MSLPLSKLLQRSPAARYQSAGVLAAELNGWLGEHFGRSEAAEELAGVVNTRERHGTDGAG